jgi:hypothetical protein
LPQWKYQRDCLKDQAQNSFSCLSHVIYDSACWNVPLQGQQYIQALNDFCDEFMLGCPAWAVIKLFSIVSTRLSGKNLCVCVATHFLPLFAN